ADGCEPIVVVPLPRQQGERVEVRQHTPEDVLETPPLPLQRPVASLRPDAPAPEVRLDRMKHLCPVSVLADREAWPHLPAHHELCPRRDRNGEAPLPVCVTGDVGREEL